MTRYYISRELSQIFNIKLARWKRWSREFLPPDPLGGMQSGYARQYTLDEAFIVYLGGHLVNHLQFSIPDTRMIMKELDVWLKEKGFLGSSNHNDIPPSRIGHSSIRQAPHWEIMFFRNHRNGRPVCLIREVVIRTDVDGMTAVMGKEIPNVTRIPPDLDPEIIQQAPSAKILFITKLLLEFIHRLGTDPGFFPALNFSPQENV